MDFGAVHLSDREKAFYKGFNSEIISLCNSLPESAQTEALLFLMKYSGLTIGRKLDFFKNYHVPSWSVIYWLTRYSPDASVLSQKDIKNAVTAHSMAMVLHSLDDHLNDGELPASHLTLLLRSQAWMVMLNALKHLYDGLDKGRKIANAFLDEYYSSILGANYIDSLDSYCNLFRKQMATWLIVPALMMQKTTVDEKFANAVQVAFESFGIAWKLLDDINDIQIDMMQGTKSSIYVCLPEDIKIYWNQVAERNNDADFKVIFDCILEIRVVDELKARICSELESAASVVDCCNMIGLAEEFRCLLRPLKNG
jgi:hypothetical protein